VVLNAALNASEHFLFAPRRESIFCLTSANGGSRVNILIWTKERKAYNIFLQINIALERKNN